MQIAHDRVRYPLDWHHRVRRHAQVARRRRRYLALRTERTLGVGGGGIGAGVVGGGTGAEVGGVGAVGGIGVAVGEVVVVVGEGVVAGGEGGTGVEAAGVVGEGEGVGEGSGEVNVDSEEPGRSLPLVVVVVGLRR